MKRFLFTCFLLMPVTWAFAQENDRADFFPLHVGDYWEYGRDSGPTPTFYNIEVIGDTLVNNELLYLYDSLPPVKEMVMVTDSSDVWRRRGTDQWTQLYRLFDLDAEIGDVYTYGLEYGGNVYGIKRIVDIYDGWLFPSSPNPLYTTYMKIEVGYVFFNGDTVWYGDEQFDLLCKDVGLVVEMRPDGGASFLYRAVVNGVEVGYPSTMAIEDDHEIIINSRAPSIVNYPNPFREQTTICWQEPSTQDVKLDIFDAGGRFVTTLFAGWLPAGEQSFQWNGTRQNGSTCSNGQYFFVRKGDSFSHTCKLILKR